MTQQPRPVLRLQNMDIYRLIAMITSRENQSLQTHLRAPKVAATPPTPPHPLYRNSRQTLHAPPKTRHIGGSDGAGARP